MRAPISVLIPTLNAAAELGPVLGAAFDAMSEGLVREVILADGGSADGTRALADRLGARVVETAPGRGVQLAAGAEVAQGDWLLVLHADTSLSPDWIDAVRDHIETHRDAGYFRLAFARGGMPGRVVAGWANLRARLFGLPYGDQGLLVPMALYRSVGGYPAVPLMEDVALARALRGRLCRLGATATTSAARYRRDGWIRRGAGNLWLLTRYLLGADPTDLATRYR